MTTTTPEQLTWHRVLSLDELPEGRVKTVSAGPHSFAVTHYGGRYAALSNRCPHQGGPLGEGSIEKGMLRCPWHGYDYCPLDGSSPFGDGVPTFPIDVRYDGIYVGVEPEAPQVRTVAGVMAETMVNWGVRHVFGMVGHSNLGLADALRRQEHAGRLTYIGIRHEGAAAFAASAYGKLTGRPAACLTIAGPGATNLLTGLWDANVDRSPVLALTGQVDTQVLGPGAFQEVDLSAAFGKVARWTQPVLESSKHAELMTLACKAVPVWGEIGVVLASLCQRLAAPPADSVDQRPEVAERRAIWRTEKASHERDDRGQGVNSAAVFAALNRHVPEDAVIAVDVGNHAYSFGRYFECKSGQSVLMSGYLGSIGFGYPAAIGAWAAAPDRPTFAITGDGGFAQYMAELLTAVKHKMNITHVLLNNGQLGKISKEQRAGDWEVWQTSLHNPDFSKYADICGALGIRVTKASQLDEALITATAHTGPALIEVLTDPDLI